MFMHSPVYNTPGDTIHPLYETPGGPVPAQRGNSHWRNNHGFYDYPQNGNAGHYVSKSAPYYESSVAAPHAGPGPRSHSEEYYYRQYINRRLHSINMRDPARQGMAHASPPRAPYVDRKHELADSLERLSLENSTTPPYYIAKHPTSMPTARPHNGSSHKHGMAQQAPFFETRFGAHEEGKRLIDDSGNRLTWSQTRRIHNLNRPMIPVSIKIPLHDKHLWWESPTITLNMFAPYSTALVNGQKTIETRNYQLPNKCKGVRIGIVEIMPKSLPSKKPELIGEVVFVDCKEYSTKEQWEADEPYHKVQPDDERFGWDSQNPNKKKFGWVVHTWQAYDRTIREAASEYCNTRVHFTKNFFVWAYV